MISLVAVTRNCIYFGPKIQVPLRDDCVCDGSATFSQ